MKTKLKHLLLILLLLTGVVNRKVRAQAQTPPKFTISGYVKEKGSSELLPGASIAIPSLKTGTISNTYGFFSITLPKGKYEVLITYIGYSPKAYTIELDKNVDLEVFMEQGNQLKEFVSSATAQPTRIAQETRMSVIEIPVQQIKDIPALLGEKDVLKVIQLLPGVQKGSEGNSGIYVRGGGPDQNLIILDDAIVYNAFHLFGFFSLFNGDALKSIELTKGGFPARYGGRLSSVIAMNMKEGNKEKLHGEAGIGILSSRLMLEGPIIKNKCSFLVSARRTYFDVLTLPFQTSDTKGGYYFYDFNAKVNYELDSKNKLYLSGYFGRDKFYIKERYSSVESSDASIAWGNGTGTLRWNHQYTPKLFSNTSLIFSDYKFIIRIDQVNNSTEYNLKYYSGIQDINVKHDLDFRPSAAHTIKAGVQVIRHLFTPSALIVKDNFGGNQNKVTTYNSFENGIYAEDEIKIGARIRLNPGLRLSYFNAGGINYFRPEPRFNGSYNLRNDLAVKASYSMMNQFIHLLSNTSVGLPTDLWVPSTSRIKPEQSWQVAAGIAKDFIEQGLLLSIEGYYKESNHIIAYKEGASFLASDPEDGDNNGNVKWDENVTSGFGWSYGSEFLLQKKQGKFTGWVGYTLSWTQMRFDELNFGKKFWAKYDRRHDISLVGMYEVRKPNEDENGIKIAGTWVYGTGNAITLPIAEYYAPVQNPGKYYDFGYNTVSQYTGRNQFRMAPYHRLDFSIQVQKKFKKYLRTWEFSVYNLYNRHNPYFYYISTSGSGKRSLMQVSIFTIIPSLSWNIKF